eukprot:4942563-Amphidinium_carterae.1
MKAASKSDTQGGIPLHPAKTSNVEEMDNPLTSYFKKESARKVPKDLAQGPLHMTSPSFTWFKHVAQNIR